MNWIDILIALIIALPAYFGFRKGFLRKLLGIAGIIIGFILAIKFYDTAAKLLSVFIKENQTLVNVLGFLLIIGILYAASIWLSKYIANINSGTSIVDKILGTITGFIQGVIVSSVLLYNLALAGIPSAQTRETSLLYSNVYKVAPMLFDKVIELFPGLQELYNEYKLPPKQQEPTQQKDPQKKQK
jgi:membrane protein required for colicin V production